MIHQLIFTKLLGEIDYGAMGDFSPAGCVDSVSGPVLDLFDSLCCGSGLVGLGGGNNYLGQLYSGCVLGN